MSLLDALQSPDGSTFDADVCIVGGGPIGITLARALRGSGLSVLLCESGGLKKNPKADALSGGTAVSPRYAPLTMYRRRVFGGASAIWGGRCVPYDPIDFEARDHVPNSGWPIHYADLREHLVEATAIADAGVAEYDARAAVDPGHEFISGFAPTGVDTHSYERFSLPTHFGQRYGAELQAALDVRVLINATCTRLQASEDGIHIGSAEFSTLDARRITVRAARFVVAAGGLESYRLLANSNNVHANGLGNSGDALGRYFMSHIEGSFADLKLVDPKRPIDWGFTVTRDGIYGRRRLQLPVEVQRKHRLMNLIVRLHHPSPVDPRHGDPVLSLMFLAKHFILAEYRRKITMVERHAAATMPKGVPFWARHAANIVFGSPALASFLFDWMRRRVLATRRLPYVALFSRQGIYPLDINAEQYPNPDSRVLLAAEKDRFGNRLTTVDWKMTDLDVQSIAGTLRVMRDEFARTGIAEIRIDDATLEQRISLEAVPIGGHHIGMARMSSSPATGVVNADLRVHDLDNVYVVGPAVLPTASHANPTLTSLALALRLADHLKATPKCHRLEVARVVK